MSEEKDRLESEKIEDTTANEENQGQTFEEPTQEQWREALEKTVAQRDEYLALAQRTQADFQNFKRRNAQARSDAYDEGVREVLAALLPTVDAVDMALKTVRESGETGSVLEGMELIQKQLADTLSKLGFEEVPALGEMFDPEYHNAVMREDGDEPGKVLEVFQNGYRVKGRILRYAMVKVAVLGKENE